MVYTILKDNKMDNYYALDQAPGTSLKNIIISPSTYAVLDDHMLDPQGTEASSIMPPYPWLFENDLDNSTLSKKISVLRYLGTPYAEGYEESALADLQKQAEPIAAGLAKSDNGVTTDELKTKEIIALIAYLQRLGTDIKAK